MKIRRTLTIYCLILFFLTSCIPTDVPVNQIIEYIPEKAGAEITAKIVFDDCDYVNYQNNQVYTVSNGQYADTVTFYDLTNDNVTVNKSVYIPKKTAFQHYTYNITRCVNIINDEMILLAGITDNSTYKNINAMLCFNENDALFTFYDHSADFENTESIYQMYYSNDTQNVYLTHQIYYDNYPIQIYNYNSISNKFDFSSNNSFNQSGKIFLTNECLILNKYYVEENKDTTNLLFSFFLDSDNQYKKINLTFLGLEYPIVSAFSSNKNSIWLCYAGYGNNNRKKSFELLKLKLLTTEASGNEYRRTGCW